jgi:hypothetical protein
MIPVLEEIGSLPDACLTDLARNLWWPARRKRAKCSGISKTRKKMSLAAGHTYPYRSVSPIRARGHTVSTMDDALEAAMAPPKTREAT